MAQTIRLGDALVQSKLITTKQLETALDSQKRSGKKLGETLIALGYVTEKDLLELLSKQMGIELYDLTKHEINFEIAKKLPEVYARQFNAILLKITPQGAVVGMADPLDINATDELKRFLHTELNIVLLRRADLARAFDLIYRHQEEISSFAGALEKELGVDKTAVLMETKEGTASESAVIKLLTTLFEDAIQVHASDIHIEPDNDVLRIRLRIDGVLHEQVIKEKAIAAALASRLKLVADLNIAEKRLPQGGRFTIKIRDKIIDVRFSTLPTQYGESLVMRLLDQSGGVLNLEKTGMDEDMLKRFRRLLNYPNGLILVTGPTGCGKSTTLYGALNELNKPEDKIITVEDPVEYRLPRINQVQVDPKLDLTFVKVLRTTLRQDPDIILVGEMRDEETARVGMQASLTGHLVLSTLHTNDAASTAIRLMDMGIEGYLVAAALRGVLAQRLIRRICDGCKAKYQLEAREKSWLDGIIKSTGIEPINEFYSGIGCVNCNHTGYRGRAGVFELLELDEAMMKDLREQNPSGFSKHAAEALKGHLLIDNGLDLVKKGITTVSEVIKMFGEI